MPLGSSLFSLRTGAARPRKCVPPHSGLRAAKGRDYSVMTKDLARGLRGFKQTDDITSFRTHPKNLIHLLTSNNYLRSRPAEF